MSTGALAAVADLVLPATCAACGAPARSVCDACSTDLLSGLVRFGGPTWVRPDPTPAGWPGCVAVTAYDGVARILVATYKDDDRRDALRVLGPLMAAAVAGALASLEPTGEVLLVPAPTSRAARRRRGRDSLSELARAATALLTRSPPVVPALAQTRRVRDQAGLGASDRQANLAGAVGVRRAQRGRLDGQPVLLVDDVVTTGATLVDCARALAAEGAVVLGAAAICATQRRSARSSQPGERPGLSSRSLDNGREFAA